MRSGRGFSARSQSWSRRVAAGDRGSRVELEEKAEAVQREIVVDHFDRLGLRSDETREAAGGDDAARICELFLEASAEPVHETCVSVDDPGLHGMNRVPADDTGRDGELDAMKTRGSREERF